MFRYTKATGLREVLLWVVVGVPVLFPFYLLIATALKSDTEAQTTSVIAPPSDPSFSSFMNVLTSSQHNIGSAFVNSAVITVGTVLGLVILGAPCAYVITRRTAAWSRITFYLVLIGILLPTQLGTLPLYKGARELGLTGSVWGVIIVWIGLLLPFSVFLYSGFYRGLGTEFEEAAALDGASRTQTFVRVVLPLMAPVTGTVTILTSMIVWNDFFQALVFLSGSKSETIPVAMYYYVTSSATNWNRIFAIVIVSMVPMLIFYVFAQKRFMQSYAGGIKG